LRQLLRRIADRVTFGSVHRYLDREGFPARISSIEARVSSAEAGIASVALRIASAEAKIASAEERISNLESDADALRATVAHLGEKVQQSDATLADAVDSLGRMSHQAQLAASQEQKARAGALSDRMLALLAYLSPEDPLPPETNFIRLGKRNDGGYVMIENLLGGGIAYSVGIATDASWDMAMVRRGYEVHQYDHTVSESPEQDPALHFHQLGVCPTGEHAPSMQSLDSLLDSNGHAARQDIVLKIDIEGGEWGVFSSLPASALQAFSQIAVEFHWLHLLDEDERYETARKSLSKLHAHFAPVHVHANNHLGLFVMGGVPVPAVLEVTYVRRDLMATEPSRRTFPTPLDEPNHPGHSELFLGRFQFSDRS